MKPTRRIVRVVDAMLRQSRLVVWLECQHKVSLTAVELAETPMVYEQLKHATHMTCPFCADVPESPAAPVSSSSSSPSDGGDDHVASLYE